MLSHRPIIVRMLFTEHVACGKKPSTVNQRWTDKKSFFCFSPQVTHTVWINASSNFSRLGTFENGFLPRQYWPRRTSTQLGGEVYYKEIQFVSWLLYYLGFCIIKTPNDLDIKMPELRKLKWVNEFWLVWAEDVCTVCYYIFMSSVMANIFHIKSYLPEVRMLNKEEKSILTKKS